MNFDPKVTEQLKCFLDAPEDARDYAHASEIVMRISGNVVRHNMIMRKGPRHFAPLLTKIIKDNYEFRLRKITHAQVVEMKEKSEAIVSGIPQRNEEIKTGKRPDHDSLPDNVKAAYIETLDCLRKQRELHLQIRSLALHTSRCPDSELYPFVKEIIALDDRRLKCWQVYDSFKREVNKAAEIPSADAFRS